MEQEQSKKVGVTDSEIKAIEAEVLKNKAEALNAMSEQKAKEIEEKVRKEMTDKIEADRLKEQLNNTNAELEKLKTEQDAKLKSQQDAFEKRLQELEATRKGVVNTQSPFEDKPNPNIRIIDGREVDISKLNLAEIEKQSAEEFRRYHNLPNWYFKKTQL